MASPTTTLDLTLPNGDAIPIEERPAEELTHIQGIRIAAPGKSVMVHIVRHFQNGHAHILVSRNTHTRV